MNQPATLSPSADSAMSPGSDRGRAARTRNSSPHTLRRPTDVLGGCLAGVLSWWRELLRLVMSCDSVLLMESQLWAEVKL